MADFTIDNASQRFPVGTSLAVYERRGWEATPPPFQPSSTMVATSTVLPDGSITFTGLPVGGAYWAGANVGGGWRWIGFRVEGELPLTLSSLDLSDSADLIRRDDATALALRAKLAVNLADYCNLDGTGDNHAGLLQAESDAGTRGLYHPGGVIRLATPTVLTLGVPIFADGPHAAFMVDVGAGNDGLVIAGPGGTFGYGRQGGNFAVISGTNGCRYGLVLRDLAHSDFEPFYVKAGGTWEVSLEGLIACGVKIRAWGANAALPHDGTRSTNGVRMVSSGAGNPCNANDFDLQVEAHTGIEVYGDFGGANEAGNNRFTGVVEGVATTGMHLIGAQGFTLADMHFESGEGSPTVPATKNTLVLENCHGASFERVFASCPVSLVGSDDIELAELVCDSLTIDSASHRTRLGHVRYGIRNGAFADSGIGTTSDGRLVAASGSDASRAGDGAPETGNLFRNPQMDSWGSTGLPTGVIAYGSPTLVRSGLGQGDTHSPMFDWALKVTGSAPAGVELQMTAQDVKAVAGRYVTLRGVVELTAGTPNILAEAIIDGGSPVITGRAVSTVGGIQVVDISFLCPAGTSSVSLRLRNSTSGTWYVLGGDFAVGRVASRIPRARAQRRRVLETGWTPGTIVAGAYALANATLPGAAVGDVVVGVAFGLAIPNGSFLQASVTAPDTVTFAIFNLSGGSITLANATVHVEVARP